jgi:hypothetical protein
MLSLLATCGPLLLLAALLLAGRFVGEERILRRLRRRAPGRRVSFAPRFRAVLSGVRSRLEQAPMSGRGPPCGQSSMS